MAPNHFQHEGPERSQSPRDWRDARLEALSLADYKANWDGEGAIPVPQVLIDSAIKFFKHLERRRDPAPDSVYPLASGAVMAEWHYADDTTVSAEIRQVGKAEVLVWHPKRPSAFEVITWDEAPARCHTGTPASNRAKRWLDSETEPPEQSERDEMIDGNGMPLVQMGKGPTQTRLGGVIGEKPSTDGGNFSLAA